MTQVDRAEGDGVSGLRPMAQVETLSDRTTELLRESIVSGHFKMGERLKEASIARELGISRGPVREALKKLRAEGLVREKPRRGAFVVELTVEDIREIYELRAAIEARAARLIVGRRDFAALEELRDVLRQLRRAAEEGDQIAFNQLDLAFHEKLCLLSKNSRLYRVFLEFAAILSILFRLEVDKIRLSLEYLLQEHETLFEALESLDVGRAEEACDSFMERAKEGLIEGLRELLPAGDRTSSPR